MIQFRKILSKLKYLIPCLVFMFLLCLQSVPSFAAPLPEDDKKAIDLDTVHHKVGAENTCKTPEATTGGEVGPGSSVYILGDSITVRTEQAYRSKLGAKSIIPIINAAESRSWTGKGSGGKSTEGSLKSGKEAIEDDAAKIKTAGGIIVALGTNGGYGSNPIEGVIDALRQKNSTAPIWWVNTAGTAAWPRNLGYLGDFNKLLTTNAGLKNFKIIDWFSTVTPGGDPKVSPTSDPGGLLADGIHPSGNGINKLSDLVAGSISSEGTADATTNNPSSCCSSSASTVAGNNNQEKVWNYLVGTMRFSAIQAAGIMGNIQQESNFSPTIVNKSSGAYGLIQWLGGREKGLEAFAREQGKEKSDLGMQLDYMKKELESSYKVRVLDPIRASTSLEDATRIWLERFEIPCTPGSAGCAKEMRVRLPNAQNWLTQFGSNTGGAVGNSQTPTCGSVDGGTGVSADGFVFPLRTTKATILSMPDGVWCTTSQVSCHHDYKAADIFAPTGTEVLAARGGKVVLVKENPGHVVIKADDGNIYYYTHMGAKTMTVSKDQVVVAGTVLGRVGTRADAQGTQQHLHIDALPGSKYGNRPACSGSACSGLPFLELQPALTAAFKGLP